MRIFLAGASGAVGTPLIRALVRHGHHVIATTRTPSKSDALRQLGAEPVIMDGLDAASVHDAVARATPDAVIHQMTALSGKPDMKHFDRWFAATNVLRTRGTDNLLEAARAANVQRFIAQSYTGWTNTRDGGPVTTEDAPLDPNPVPAQRETLQAIQYLERAVLGAPLQGIALRYGSFYGPGASDSMVTMVRKRMLPIIGNGAGIWSWIHVDDAAEATVAALDHGERGVYHIVDDDPAPVSEWLPAFARAVGAKPPFHVPVWLGRLLAGEVAVQSMTNARGASNAKAKRVLEWNPRWSSWRDGFWQALFAA